MTNQNINFLSRTPTHVRTDEEAPPSGGTYPTVTPGNQTHQPGAPAIEIIGLTPAQMSTGQLTFHNNLASLQPASLGSATTQPVPPKKPGNTLTYVGGGKSPLTKQGAKLPVQPPITAPPPPPPPPLQASPSPSPSPSPQVLASKATPPDGPPPTPNHALVQEYLDLLDLPPADRFLVEYLAVQNLSSGAIGLLEPDDIQNLVLKGIREARHDHDRSLPEPGEIAEALDPTFPRMPRITMDAPASPVLTLAAFDRVVERHGLGRDRVILRDAAIAHLDSNPKPSPNFLDECATRLVQKRTTTELAKLILVSMYETHPQLKDDRVFKMSHELLTAGLLGGMEPRADLIERLVDLATSSAAYRPQKENNLYA